MVCYELGALWSLLLWCHTEQLYPCPHVLLLRIVCCSSNASLSVVEEVHHSGAADSVCLDNLPDQLWCCLAVCISYGVAVFSDFLHDFFDYPLHKFLYSDLQQEGILEEERVSEWLHGHCERVHKQLFFPWEQCETKETKEGLKTKLKNHFDNPNNKIIWL